MQPQSLLDRTTSDEFVCRLRAYLIGQLLTSLYAAAETLVWYDEKSSGCPGYTTVVKSLDKFLLVL